MRAALEIGWWTFKAPLGFLNSQTKAGPSLIHDPARAELLKLACTSVADGKSVSEVLRQANAAGLRTDRGRPLSLQTFHAVLRNPIIAGIIRIPRG